MNWREVGTTGKYKEVGRTRVHVAVVEAVLGKGLPPGVVVHHVDRDRGHNEHTNLVVCPDRAYHAELHRKQHVQDAGYNPWVYKYCNTCDSFKLRTTFGEARKDRRNQWETKAPMCKQCACNRERKARAKSKHT